MIAFSQRPGAFAPRNSRVREVARLVKGRVPFSWLSVKRQMSYQDHIIEMSQLVKSKNGSWDGIDPEAVARMRLQNRFKTGL